jgi:hypothetical protein
MAVRTASARAYRESHLQRMQAAGIHLFTVTDDGHPCPLCFPWQNRVITDTADGTHPTIADATAAGLFHPNCFPGFVPVSAPTGVVAADSRWYEGELVVIHTALGNELSVTPNHPVLTPEGWVAAGDLVVGQHIVSYNGEVERVNGVSPDDQQVPAPIGEVFDTLRHSSGVTTVRVPSSAEQFHGDGFDSEVEVVFVDGLLQDGRYPEAGEYRAEGSLFVGGMRFGALLPLGSSNKVVVGPAGAAHSVVGIRGDGGAFGSRHSSHTSGHDFAEVGSDSSFQEPLADLGLSRSESFADLSLRHAGLFEDDSFIKPRGFSAGDKPLFGDTFESAVDHIDADANGGRDLAGSLSARVPGDYVVEVERRNFAGHVYNLQSGDGWYVAGSIVVHNCRHSLVAVIPGVTVLPKPREWSPADQAAYDATQKQRRLEVGVRKAKRELEYALTPEAKAEARKAVRAAQAKVREFVNANPDVLKRYSRREQTNLSNHKIKLPQ